MPEGAEPREGFDGFPAIAQATAIPNLFFARVLPEMVNTDELLAFLWVSRLVQEQRGEARFVTNDDVWAAAGAGASFEAMGGGREGLDRGLRGCVLLGALLAAEISDEAGVATMVYLVNNPPSRRALIRARAGELELRPRTRVVDIPAPRRPDIFRIYEEHIGTITPFVAERLIAAQDHYPWPWIEDAFREAAVTNARSWRYVERVLENMEREGRSNEETGRDSLESRERRYLGGARGPIGYR